MRIPVVLIFLLFSSAPVHARSALHRGENLIQPMPIPGEGWETASRNEGGTRSVRWSRPETGEHLTTTIASGGRDSTSAFRETNDRTGRDHCETFSTTTILEGTTNGYDREIWLASCGRGESDGDGFSLLHQVIAGRDSTYYLVKRWPGAPDEAALATWTAYFEQVTVCDTRARRGAPCPEFSRPETD